MTEGGGCRNDRKLGWSSWVFRAFTLALVGLGLSTPATVYAATATWDGGAGTGLWSTAVNWGKDTAIPAGGDSLVFNAAAANGQFSITLGANRTSGGITFSSTGINGFTFNNAGTPATFAFNGLTNNNAATQTFGADLTLIVSSAQTWAAASGDFDFQSSVTLSQTLTLSGAGNQAFSGLLTVSGNNRTLTNNSTGAVSFSDINLSEVNTGRTLTLGGTGATSVTGVIANGGTGAGNVTKTGAGALTLSGANTYSGTTTLTAGTLSAGHDQALGTSTLALNGGTLAASGAARTLANTVNLAASSTIGGSQDLTLSGAFANTSGAAATLTVNNAGATTLSSTVGLSTRVLTVAGTGDVSMTGVVSGGTGGGITMTNTGSLTLSGDNTYSGTTTLTAGTLFAGHDRALGTGTVSLNGGTLAASGAARTLANTVNLAASSTIGGSQDLTLSGAFANTSGAAATLTVNNTGATTLSSTVGLSSRILTVAGTGDVNMTGVVSGTGGGVTLSNTGTLILSGANTYTGATTLNSGAGVLRATTSASAIGTGTSALTLAGGELQLANDTGLAFNRNTTVTGNTSIASDRLTSGAGVTQTLGTLSLGANTLSVRAGDNVTSGTAGVTFGTTTLSANNATLNVGTGANLTLGAVGGAFSLIKNGAGTLTLDTASTRTTTAGSTTLNAGTLQLGNASSLNTNAATALNLNGGTLLLRPTSNTNTVFNGTATTIGGSATIVADRASSGAALSHTLGTLSIGSQTLTIGAGSNVTSGTAGVTFGATTVTGDSTFSTNAGTLLTLGALNGGVPARTLTKDGAGTLTLGTAATSLASGSVINVNNGVLNSNNATALGSQSRVNLGPGATVNLGATQTFGALDGTGGTVNLNANTLTVGGTDNLSSTYNGTITGSGSLVKAGTGSLTLGATNSYSGSTTINAGSLVINATNVFNDASLLSVNTGATLSLNNQSETIGRLAGAGTIDFGNGTLTLDSGASTFGGTFQGAGTLVINSGASLTLSASFNDSNLNIVLNGGSLYLGSNQTQAFGNLSVISSDPNYTSVIDFGSTGATSATFNGVNITGSSTLLSVQNWVNTVDYFFTISNPGAQGTAPINQIVFSGYPGSDSKWLNYGGKGQITPVPEPSTYGAIFVGAAAGLVLAVRRRRDR